MTDIRVTIDCDGEYCGGCYRYSFACHPFQEETCFYQCSIFGERLEKVDLSGATCMLKRCKACLEAQIDE